GSSGEVQPQDEGEGLLVSDLVVAREAQHRLDLPGAFDPQIGDDDLVRPPGRSWIGLGRGGGDDATAAADVAALAHQARDRCPAEDRKSTRLNSSHVSISYAVFCLKKKKKRH